MRVRASEALCPDSQPRHVAHQQICAAGTGGRGGGHAGDRWCVGRPIEPVLRPHESWTEGHAPVSYSVHACSKRGVRAAPNCLQRRSSSGACLLRAQPRRSSAASPAAGTARFRLTSAPQSLSDHDLPLMPPQPHAASRTKMHHSSLLKNGASLLDQNTSLRKHVHE